MDVDCLFSLLASLLSRSHFCELQATFDCLMKTYGFLTPEFWTETKYIKTPFQEFTDLLAKPTKGLLIEPPTETVEA